MDCKRVNVFIGEPNVGKSNILEAMALLNINSVVYDNNIQYGIIRIQKKLNELFFDSDINNLPQVTASNTRAEILNENGTLYLIKHLFEETNKAMQETIAQRLKGGSNSTKIDLYNFLRSPQQNDLQYQFVELDLKNDRHVNYSNQFEKLQKVFPFIFDKAYFNSPNSFNKKNFIPPYGENLVEILNSNQDLYEYIDEAFKKYGLRFSINDDELSVVKYDKKLKIFPFENTADTFQRLIFYLAAIETNSDSVLILEEPEVHSFPPYIAELGQRIVSKKDNQFFITTHSPYMFNEFIDNLDHSELNVNVVHYKDYETKIRPLTEEEIKRASETGTDIFFNLDRYV